MAAAAAPHAHQAAMGTTWFRPGKRRKRKDYNDAYRARPQDDAGAVAQRLARAAHMRDYRARPRTEEQAQAQRDRCVAYIKHEVEVSVRPGSRS
jgi:hypothetical protein